MNIKSGYLSSNMPDKLYCQPPCVLGMPFNTEISDSWSVGGSGIGCGSNSLKTATGEYFERKQFYTRVLPDVQKPLSYSLNMYEVNNFLKAFLQTSCMSYGRDALRKHVYNLTKVVRASDFTECYIPTACISLNHYGLGKDNHIFPSKDTCGCSFHWDAEKSMFGSIKECLERQFLTRFWLTGQHVERMSAQQIVEISKGGDNELLVGMLSKSGEIIAFDISDPSFPGACIIVFYGQANMARRVKYCTGMAYSNTTADALNKAFEELWQTYRFIDLFVGCNGDVQGLKDSYLRHFFSCNTYTCFLDVTVSRKVKIFSDKNHDEFTLEGMLRALDDLDISGYFYTSLTRVDNNMCVFSKFVSPQLFMHMDNSKNINAHNDYSRGFKKQIIVGRQCRMVPFP